MTYVLPESVDWIGWVAAALLILSTVYLFYRQRKKKDDTAHLKWFPIDGFGSLWMPIEIEQPEEDSIIWNIANTKRMVWKQADKCYGYSQKHPWPVDLVSIAKAKPSLRHPEVLWSPGGHKIYLRYQKKMYYWFARECHNVYRWQMHGPKWVYKIKDEADGAAAEKLEGWIEEALGRSHG